MPELLSVGLDVGTTTTQLIVSRLLVEDRASAFAVPDLEITRRQVLYRSPVHFTPLIDEELVDGQAIRALVEKEYSAAGITREMVDSGAVIITGETSRKENAAAVLGSLAGFAGQFVVATAGPDLESVLAAKGSGAVAYSRDRGKTVLHMDIGGGTTNLALVEDGVITATACLNVGGRLIKLDGQRITYVSPVLEGQVRVGEMLSYADARRIADRLVQVLEMAAGLREKDERFDRLTTRGTKSFAAPPAVISFSGGVADCIGSKLPWLTYGDLGVVLGQAIGESALCRNEHRLGAETIRATVIGAGCHSTQLSGSTVFVEGVELPQRDLPVVHPQNLTAPAIAAALRPLDRPGVLALGGEGDYAALCALAEEIAGGIGERPCYVALEADAAKALGHALRLRLPQRPILCIDRLRLPPGSYLDVSTALASAYPVVIKTLVLDT